jgi:hypothetical protein
VVGFLFRGWVLEQNGKQGHPGLAEIVNDAIQRREDRLKGLQCRGDIIGVVRGEGRILRTLAMKMERYT